MSMIDLMQSVVVMERPQYSEMFAALEKQGLLTDDSTEFELPDLRDFSANPAVDKR